MLKFNDKRGYRKFVNERDQALEIILRNSRLRITASMNKSFGHVLLSIKGKYDRLMSFPSRQVLNELENHIETILEHLAFVIWMEVIEMRKKAYMLSYSGEAQAISQTIAKTPKLSLSRQKLDEKMNKTLQGTNVMPMRKFVVHFAKLRRTIVSSIEHSLLLGESSEQALGRIYLHLPKQYILPKKKVLKTVKVTEARKPKFSTFGPGDESSGFELQIDRQSPVHGFEWDQETWDKIIDDLGSDHVLTDRSPANYIDMVNPNNNQPIRDDIPEEEKVYGWEVEKDVVHDFVEEVRKGQVEAANKQGIKDFVWISIIDDKTCSDCCEWRSGLTTSEIEVKLKSDRRDDICQAVVPPAHFNCRCTLAPASDDLEAIDNSDAEREFSEWLENV